MKVEFEKLESLCQLAKEKFELDLSEEIYGLVQVYSIEKYSLLSSISVFETHRKIQEDIRKTNAAEGYELLLTSLNEAAENGDFKIYQLNIITEKRGYILFTDLDLSNLFGLLIMNKQIVNKELELNESGELRGAWTSRGFYLKGISLN